MRRGAAPHAPHPHAASLFSLISTVHPARPSPECVRVRVRVSFVVVCCPQLFCPDPEALRAEADWPGAGAASRQGTLRELLLLLPIKDVVPEGRLEELVEQAVGAQMDRCLFHNALGRARPPSLMRDYVAGPEQLPSREADVKDGHGDEVWHVQWSNDGRRLATASKNGGAAVWELQMGPEGPRLRLQHMLKGHQGAPRAVTCLMCLLPAVQRLRLSYLQALKSPTRLRCVLHRCGCFSFPDATDAHI